MNKTEGKNLRVVLYEGPGSAPLPAEDRYNLTRSQLEDRIAVLLGGRAAELLIYGEVSTGDADDLQKAVQLAAGHDGDAAALRRSFLLLREKVPVPDEVLRLSVTLAKVAPLAGMLV